MASKQIQVTQSSAFARGYKKLHQRQKQDVDAAVNVVIADPHAGKLKRRNLTGVYDYKFKSQT